jgi:hypothetical protein
MSEPISQPERDRAQAGRPRYRARYAQSLSDEMAALLGSETFRRLKRFQQVNDVFAECLSPAHVAKIKPISSKAGLTLRSTPITHIGARWHRHFAYSVAIGENCSKKYSALAGNYFTIRKAHGA